MLQKGKIMVDFLHICSMNIVFLKDNDIKEW